MYQLTALETLLMAIALGVAFAFSVRQQHRLHQVGLSDESKSPLVERITYVGLSLAILFGAIVAARTISGLEKYDFIGIFFAAVGATWLLLYLQRSNRQFDRDA